MGNPQHRFPTIHVTGTSGKGSTSTIIASMLTAAGYRVGLRTSPFLQVATEKLQIGGKLIGAESFRNATHRVLACASVTMGELDDIGYAEAWSAISFQWFADRNVDLAVIEVGAGGEFDSTNVIEPAVSVITSVGMDHVVSLGPTLADIAWHKAGIIKSGGVAVVGPMPDAARRVIDQRARAVGARIVDAHEPESAQAPAMYGAFQRTNAAIALATVKALQEQGFLIPETAALHGIRTARIPGRLEKMPYCHEPAVWIDGAHNADKIAALVREAHQLSSGSELPIVVLGMLASKDATPIVDKLIPVASAIVTTQPTVVGKTSVSALALRQLIEERGFAGELLHEKLPVTALDRALALAGKKQSSVLVTGSLYLAGELRSRWFPDDEIVLQRTAWPTTR
jgi:dihydrofolate synthase/folylpolyglutamate synthase